MLFSGLRGGSRSQEKPIILPSLLALTALLSGTKSLPPGQSAEALFAGGSFWCLEAALEAIPGVDSVIAGYAGTAADSSRPDFESVASGQSPFVQAVRVYYHPRRVAYADLLEAYWRNIDPTRADGQFSDAGPQYRPILFYADAGQRTAAEASYAKLRQSHRFSAPLVVRIAPVPGFQRAEEAHQDYARKNSGRYQAYLRFSGRAAFLKKSWAGRPRK